MGRGIGLASVSPLSSSGASVATFTAVAAIWMVVVQMIATRTGISQQEAAKRVDDAIAQIRAAETKARQAADTGAELSRHDLVKGYEYKKGSYLVVEESDFETARGMIARRERAIALMPLGCGPVARALHGIRELNSADALFDEPPDARSGAPARNPQQWAGRRPGNRGRDDRVSLRMVSGWSKRL